jgi:SAM-dependent methyltransferase
VAQEQLTQSEYWNGLAAERWITGRERLDRSMASIAEAALAVAAPRPGERVLDVGCGCGTTSIMLAERVGDSVLGVDISGPMLAEARRRAPSLRFLEADAASHRFEAAFDLLFSRFGVMFFADPPAAFRNLRAALAPGGRMVFVCWRAFRDNPWAFTPLTIARDLLPPSEPFDPEAPGPFAFADRDRLERILAAAGFAEITISAHEDVMHIGADPADAADYSVMVGPLARAMTGLPEETRELIRARVTEAFAEYTTPHGVQVPARVWLVVARG